uniref:Thiamine biosynthesis protein n=1 Tax=Pleurosigma intermedium TaxID=197753 RepID=UPI0021824C2C|nr:Thiamine biosynthesis protein [Pleurosigma intermedium]UVG42026.1 Thiamine biosynthesis protein [Pleurosigma intermedium]
MILCLVYFLKIFKIKFMSKVNFFLNGQEYYTQYDITLFDLITYFNYDLSLLVLEYNNLICNKKDWNNIFVTKNDKIEIVTIVGGG